MRREVYKMGMNVGITDYTLGIITTDKGMKTVGGCPIIYADDNKDLQYKAMLMSKSVGGMVHFISKETLIVVKHQKVPYGTFYNMTNIDVI